MTNPTDRMRTRIEQAKYQTYYTDLRTFWRCQECGEHIPPAMPDPPINCVHIWAEFVEVRAWK